MSRNPPRLKAMNATTLALPSPVSGIGLPRTRRSVGTDGARNGDLAGSLFGEWSRGLLLARYLLRTTEAHLQKRRGSAKVRSGYPLSRQDSHFKHDGIQSLEFDAIVADITSNHSHILMTTDCLLTHVSSHMITWQTTVSSKSTS
jgi:hypothetical protein